MSGEGRDDGWAEVAVAVELQGFGNQDVVGMVGVKQLEVEEAGSLSHSQLRADELVTTAQRKTQ